MYPRISNNAYSLKAVKVFQFNHVSFFLILEAGILSSVLFVLVICLYKENARRNLSRILSCFWNIISFFNK
jgi:hypothetical protein